jgi:enoyl-CoA hydratase/carnithine racemase
VGRKAALEMLMTGRFVPAPEAAVLGLINRAVPAEDLDALVDEVALAIAGKAPDAIALGRAAFNRQIGLPLADGYATATRAMAENLSFASAKTGIDGFLKH